MLMRRLLLITIFAVAIHALCPNSAIAASSGKIILGYASPGRALPF